MTLETDIYHRWQSPAPDGADPARLQPSKWDESHKGNGLGLFNVRDYADGVGTGGDDTDAFDGTAAASDGAMLLPEGSYRYEGAGIDGEFFHIKGAGAAKTTIILPGGVVFMKPSGVVQKADVSGIHFSGGVGAFQQTYTGVNVRDGLDFAHCIFSGYTGAAIGSLAEDCPYWKIHHNHFDGVSTSSIGIALSGDNAGSVVSDNDFRSNRYHIKCGWCGTNFVIRDNDFVRFDTPANPTTSIWLVSRPSVWSGWINAPLMTGNKFGSENLRSTDYHVLCAAEGAGSSFLTRYHSPSSATGLVEGLDFVHNDVEGAGTPAPPFIYSTVSKMKGLVVADNKVGGTLPDYLVEFLDVDPADTDWADGLNYIGPNRSTWGIAPSNRSWLGEFVDPHVQTPDALGSLRTLRAGADPEYVSAISGAVAGYTLSGLTVTGSQTDAYGRATAELLTVAGASGSAATFEYTPIVDIPILVELDVKAGGGTPVDNVRVLALDGTNATSPWFRDITPPAAWRTYRFWFVPRSTHGLQFYISMTTGTVLVGRVSVYQAREPINNGPVQLEHGTRIYSGAGTPEAAVTAPVGALYLRTDGGATTTLYVKTSGAGNTGWTAK